MNIALLLAVLFIPFQPTNRKLLLFGKSSPEFARQLDLLKQDSLGMTERDLIMIVAEEDQYLKK
jgi:hypothetical protein